MKRCLQVWDGWQLRPEKSLNERLATGAVEVESPAQLTVLNANQKKRCPSPVSVHDDGNVREELRCRQSLSRLPPRAHGPSTCAAGTATIAGRPGPSWKAKAFIEVEKTPIHHNYVHPRGRRRLPWYHRVLSGGELVRPTATSHPQLFQAAC